jgi:nitrite reductase (NADH) small subunit
MLTPVCRTEDVPVGEGRVAVVDGHRVAVFRVEDGFRALDTACPDARCGSLADGLLADSSVTCPLHLRRYDLATGEALGHESRGVAAHPVEVRGDAVYVGLAHHHHDHAALAA